MRRGGVETRQIAVAAGVALVALAGAPGALFGYIDPGTGSFLAQLAAAVVFGSLLTVKQSWRKLARLFGRGEDGAGESTDA